MLKLVAAYSIPFRVIGNLGRLPWHYKEDLAKFRMDVQGCTLLGGPATLKQVAFLKQPSIEVHSDFSWENIKALSSQYNYAIIGGQEIFKKGIQYADMLYLTEIQKTYTGDRYFPDIPSKFECIWEAQSAQEPDLIYKTWRIK